MVQNGPFIWTVLFVLMLGTIIPVISCYVMFKIAHYRNTLPGKQSTIHSGVYIHLILIYLGGGGGLKKTKIVSNQFSCHLR